MKLGEKYDAGKDSPSPPTRGARIETSPRRSSVPGLSSPPTRGARIETPIVDWVDIVNGVAPHAGGAD